MQFCAALAVIGAGAGQSSRFSLSRAGPPITTSFRGGDGPWELYESAAGTIFGLADGSSRTEKRLVFVSHSGLDTWVAKQIAREIAACGATPFLDEAQVDAGADFEEDILDFLQRAHELVVLLTPWALERPYVWAEIGAAWGRRIPIMALLLGITAAEMQVRPAIPVLLKKRDLLELNDIEVYLEQLAARVQRKG